MKRIVFITLFAIVATLLLVGCEEAPAGTPAKDSLTDAAANAGGDSAATFSLVGGTTAAKPGDLPILTRDQAKAVALAHAKVEETAIRDLDIDLDYEGGAHYDIDFEVGADEYDYEIDLYTGAVRRAEKNDRPTTTVTTPPAQTITPEEAKAVALAHAKVEETAIRDLDIDLDYEGGAHYDIDFEVGADEYDYEIDLYTGAVRRAEKNDRPTTSVTTPPAQTITPEEAKVVALAHAGVAEQAISRYRVDYEAADHVYDIEFVSGGMEYEYEIDSLSAKILKSEKEPLD